MDPEKERRKNELVNDVIKAMEQYLLYNAENGDVISAEIKFPGEEDPYIVVANR